jgi:thioredoxin-like negative regulator of GroEL
MVKLVTIDADAEPEIAQRYNVMSMPTILLFNKGEVVRRQVGAVPRHMLEKMILELFPA